MANPYGTYINPKTGQPVELAGTLGEQNVQANRLGYDWKATPAPTVGTAMAPVVVPKALEIPTPGAGITATSASELVPENDLKTKVQTAYTEDPLRKDEFNKDQASLQADLDALTLRRESEAKILNEQFDIKKQQMGGAQAGEKGTFTSTMARIGGYLGESASATGALVNLNQQHQYQLNDLEAKRASAVQAAKNAVDDKQFDLARLKSNEAKDYVKEIAASKQQFFQNAMAITQENRQQEQYQRTAIKDKLNNLQYLSPDKISPETKSEIDKFYGTHGFTDNYLTVTNQTANAKTQKEIMDARKATLDFLQSIPAGQSLTISGQEYTGMGKSGDVQTFTETDDNGYTKLIAYNKLTGKISYTDLGKTGKATSASGAGTASERTMNAIASISEVFAPGVTLKDGTPALDENGYATPEAFKEALKAAPKGGLSRKDVITEFGHLLFSDEKEGYKKYGLTANEELLISK